MWFWLQDYSFELKSKCFFWWQIQSIIQSAIISNTWTHFNVTQGDTNVWLRSFTRGEISAFNWRSALAGGRLWKCLGKCHQSLGHSPWNTMLHFSRVFPSGSHKDRSSWLDGADNSKLLALRNDLAGLGVVFKASDWEKCHRYSAS